MAPAPSAGWSAMSSSAAPPRGDTSLSLALAQRCATSRRAAARETPASHTLGRRAVCAHGMDSVPAMGYTLLNHDDPSIESFRGAFFKMRKALGTTAFGINEIRLPPNSPGVEHNEADTGHEEVYVVIEGSGTFTIDGEAVEVAEGDYVRVDADSTRVVVGGDAGSDVPRLSARSRSRSTTAAPPCEGGHGAPPRPGRGARRVRGGGAPVLRATARTGRDREAAVAGGARRLLVLARAKRSCMWGSRSSSDRRSRPIRHSQLRQWARSMASPGRSSRRASRCAGRTRPRSPASVASSSATRGATGSSW